MKFGHGRRAGHGWLATRAWAEARAQHLRAAGADARIVFTFIRKLL